MLCGAAVYVIALVVVVVVVVVAQCSCSYLSTCLSTYFFICPSICLSIHLSVSLSLSLSPPIFPSAQLQLENEAILRDFLIFPTWQRQNWNRSGRLPQFSKVDNIKNEAILRDFLQKWKLSAELTASSQCLLRFFDSTCLNYCACYEKVIPGHTKCCTCHAKSSQQTWRSDAPKCNPS